MEFKLYNRIGGRVDQDMSIKIVNKGSNAEIQVFKSERNPVWIDPSKVMAYLINNHVTTEYCGGCTGSKWSVKEWANGGLTDEINELEKKLEEMKFIRKVARRKNITIVNKTGVDYEY